MPYFQDIIIKKLTNIYYSVYLYRYRIYGGNKYIV